MIPIELIQSIQTEIQEAVKDYKLAAEGQEDKKVMVYA